MRLFFARSLPTNPPVASSSFATPPSLLSSPEWYKSAARWSLTPPITSVSSVIRSRTLLPVSVTGFLAFSLSSSRLFVPESYHRRVFSYAKVEWIRDAEIKARFRASYVQSIRWAEARAIALLDGAIVLLFNYRGAWRAVSQKRSASLVISVRLSACSPSSSSSSSSS